VVSILLRRDVSITMNEEEYIRVASVIFKEKAPQVLAQYPPLPNNARNYDQFVKLGTYYMFECPTRQAALGFVRTMQSSVYSYRFSHAPDFLPRLGNFLKCFGEAACHALELPFMWHMESLALIPLSRLFTPEEEDMSQAMVSYWTSFASGNIDAGAAIAWPLLDLTQQRRLNFDTPITNSNWEQATCDFWDTIGYTY